MNEFVYFCKELKQISLKKPKLQTMYSAFEKLTLCIAWLFVLVPFLFLFTHWGRNRKPKTETEKGGKDE